MRAQRSINNSRAKLRACVMQIAAWRDLFGLRSGNNKPGRRENCCFLPTLSVFGEGAEDIGPDQIDGGFLPVYFGIAVDDGQIHGLSQMLAV